MSGKNVQGSRLSWKETLSFSSGEMGTNLLFAVTSAYLLVYYTNMRKSIRQSSERSC